MSTLAEIVEAMDAPAGAVVEVVATGSPADITLRADEGTSIVGVRIDGYGSVVRGSFLGWEVEVLGEPVQFGAIIEETGLVWGDPPG